MNSACFRQNPGKLGKLLQLHPISSMVHISFQTAEQLLFIFFITFRSIFVDMYRVFDVILRSKCVKKVCPVLYTLCFAYLYKTRLRKVRSEHQAGQLMRPSLSNKESDSKLCTNCLTTWQYRWVTILSKKISEVKSGNVAIKNVPIK